MSSGRPPPRPGAPRGAPRPGRPPPTAALAARPSTAAPKEKSYHQAHARRLLAPFRRRGADGKLKYSKAERKRVYQLLMVTLLPPARFDALGPELQRMAGELSVAAGVKPGATPKDAMAALQAYFKKNPPNAELLADLNAVLASIGKELEAAARKAAAPKDVREGDLAPPAPDRLGVQKSSSGRAPDAIKGLFGMLDLAAASRKR